MRAYVIKNGKYIFDFEKESYVETVSETCLLPTKQLAELIIYNLFDGDGEVEEIDYEPVDDRFKAYHEGYKQGMFDEKMNRNNE